MARFRRHRCGFTLIETLVVLVISVGLVALVATLYRSVGRAAVTLRGGNTEWIMQNQLRAQLAQGFRVNQQAWFSGSPRELFFFTWMSRSSGLDGQPVIAHYRFDAGERALLYRELPVIAWWPGNTPTTLGQSAIEVARTNPVRIMAGIDDLEFRFAEQATDSLDRKLLKTEWSDSLAPLLVGTRVTTTRTIDFWFDLRSIDAR